MDGDVVLVQQFQVEMWVDLASGEPGQVVEDEVRDSVLRVQCLLDHPEKPASVIGVEARSDIFKVLNFDQAHSLHVLQRILVLSGERKFVLTRAGLSRVAVGTVCVLPFWHMGLLGIG